MTDRIASLGMYDHPAQRGANDRLWAAIAAVLRTQNVAGVPDRLDRTRDVQAIWRDPALLFGQACGYPLVTDPTLTLRVVALPVYAVPGCVGATHLSLLVARRDDERMVPGDFRGSRAAINDRGSNTGSNLFRAALVRAASAASAGTLGALDTVFDAVIETGSHRASLNAVRSGVADLAAIDCVTYAAIARFEPDSTAALKIVAQSPASPTLPFVTAAANDPATVAALRIALERVAADPDLAADRAAVFLRGIVAADDVVLAPIAALHAEAAGTEQADRRLR